MPTVNCCLGWALVNSSYTAATMAGVNSFDDSP